jgi:tRNA A37 N6-isopentenylltransferase MiaA
MMSEIDQSMNETPINRVKRFLEIYRYTQADATKKKKEMDELKMAIKILLDNYKSHQINTTVYTQQMLVDISDNYKKFKEVEEKYIFSQRKVENVKRIIESVNIRPYIHNAINEFNFEL